MKCKHEKDCRPFDMYHCEITDDTCGFNKKTYKECKDFIEELPQARINNMTQQCKDCKEVFEDEEELAECPDCHSKRIERR